MARLSRSPPSAGLNRLKLATPRFRFAGPPPARGGGGAPPAAAQPRSSAEGPVNNNPPRPQPELRRGVSGAVVRTTSAAGECRVSGWGWVGVGRRERDWGEGASRALFSGGRERRRAAARAPLARWSVLSRWTRVAVKSRRLLPGSLPGGVTDSAC